MGSTVNNNLIAVRVHNMESLAWFHETFPWRGSLSGFVNECLDELRKEWGDSPAPHSIVPQVVRRVSSKGF